MTNSGRILRLRLRSVFDMLDFVQVVSDRVGVLAGLDDDTIHWVGVSVRESVINAIKHGNKLDREKQVVVEFAFVPVESPSSLVITVLDEGQGFDSEAVADPLAPENVLKASGRGIFFMRNFMDDVVLRKRPEGGMEVTMTKRLPAVPHSLLSQPAK
jgi:serine/threonine-protein kinase RsbW